MTNFEYIFEEEYTSHSFDDTKRDEYIESLILEGYTNEQINNMIGLNPCFTG